MTNLTRRALIGAAAATSAGFALAQTPARADAFPTVLGKFTQSITTSGWQPLYEPGCGGWITSLAISPHDDDIFLVGGDMLGVGRSTDKGLSWGQTSGFASWEICAFTFDRTDPDVVWVGTLSGPYKSTDAGVSWTSKRVGMPAINSGYYSAPIQRILFDETDSSLVRAAGGCHRRWEATLKYGVVWGSTDGGDSWTQLSQFTDAVTGVGLNIVAMELDAGSVSTMFAAVDQKGVYYTSDGGVTWTARNSGLPHTNVQDLATHPTVAGTAWVTLGAFLPSGTTTYLPGGVYVTTDFGVTWTAGTGLAATSGATAALTSNYRAVAVSATDPSILITSDNATDHGVVYKSSDGGSSWSIVCQTGDVDSAMPSTPRMTQVAIDPVDCDVFIAAGPEYAIRSLDGGATWLEISSERVGPAGDNKWRGRGYEGWVTEQFAFHPTDPTRSYMMALDHGNFWRSDDTRASWGWPTSGMPNWGGVQTLAFASGSTLYAALGQSSTFLGLARSTDDGDTWTVMSGSAAGLPALSAAASKAIGMHADPTTTTTAWATIGGSLYGTTDGATWSVLQSALGLTWIVGNPASATEFWVGGAAGVYHTTDGGTTLTLMTGSPAAATRLELDSAGRLYATAWRASGGGLWRYASGTWTKIRNDRFVCDVTIDPANTSRIAVVTCDDPYHDASFATGVWLSGDDGATWTQTNSGLSILRGTNITINPHDSETLIVGTDGRGFYTTSWT